MLTNDRKKLRDFYLTTWEKAQNNEVLSPLEAQIAELLRIHPEYHEEFKSNDCLDKDYRENNPFLHLSLHMALREQLDTNRPEGIREVFEALMTKHQDPHHVYHLMMEVLAQTLWEMQNSGKSFDEQSYLNALRG